VVVQERGRNSLKEESPFETLERGVRAHARRNAPILRSPVAHFCSSSLILACLCLTLAHQAHLLEQREVREYLGELKADFTSLPTANLITSCYPSTQTQRAPSLRFLARQKSTTYLVWLSPKPEEVSTERVSRGKCSG
jgi:hypothetical protein